MKNQQFNLHERWEKDLENLLFLNMRDSYLKRVYICSPCRAKSAADVLHNIKAAKIYMYYSIINLNVLPKAPHGYIPFLLDDFNENERSMAIEFGTKLLHDSDQLFVCGKMLSEGMITEILEAAKLEIPIKVFDSDLKLDVKKLVTRNSLNNRLIKFIDSHPFLSFTAHDLQSKEGALSYV